MVDRLGCVLCVLAKTGDLSVPIICDDEPCENYGKCTVVEGEAVCTCPPGYTGPDCDSTVYGSLYIYAHNFVMLRTHVNTTRIEKATVTVRYV